MDITPAALIEGVALTDAEVGYYVVSDELFGAGLGDITLLNTDAAEVTVSVWLIPEGDTSGVANAILKDYVLPPTIPQNFSFRKFMNPGTTIAALASVTDVVAFSASGVTVTE